MNYKRLALSAIVATVVDMLYGFAVYGTALAGEVSMYGGGVFRPIEAVNARLPWLVVGLLLAMFMASYLYAKGYENGRTVQEGFRFGVVMGLFAIGYIVIGNYVVTRIGRRLSVYMAAAGFVEWVLVGIAIGLVYRPRTRPS
jgi:hypothetical protein